MGIYGVRLPSRAMALVSLLAAFLVTGTGTPADATTPRPSLLVLGDSIAAGSGQGGTGPHGWPALVADRLGLTLRLDGKGGTGYTTAGHQPGGRTYPRRVGDAVRAAPDVVIVEGSRNDTGRERTGTAALDTLRRLRAGLPHARILVIGPVYSSRQPLGTDAADEAVAAAAREVGLPYLSPVRRGWFTGSAHRFIGADGVHPTNAGHAYLADLIRPELARLLPHKSVQPATDAR